MSTVSNLVSRRPEIRTPGTELLETRDLLLVSLGSAALSRKRSQSHLGIDPAPRHRVHDEDHANHGERHDRPTPQAALLPT